MIASCLVRQKTSKRYKFDYKIPQELGELKPLSLVEVPFLNKKVQALVLETKQESPFAQKNILRKLTEAPLLTNEQIKLAKLVSYEFLSNPSEAVFSFLPAFNKSDLKIMPEPAKLQASKSTKTFFVESSTSSRLQFYIQKITKDAQNLLVLPEVTKIADAQKLIKQINPSLNIFVWHSGLPAQAKAKAWRGIASGQGCLVVSTRHGLFLPFRNLDNIFLDEPTSFGYFEDQEPRYNAYKASRLVSKIYHNNLFFGDSSSSAEIFALIKKNAIDKITIQEKLDIDRAPELKAIFSLPKFARAFAKARKILVLGNFSKTTRLICQDCEQEIVCPHCTGELFGQESKKCFSCSMPMPDTCPKCQSVKIKESFFTLSNIVKEIERHLNTAASSDESSSAKIIVKSLEEIENLRPIYELAILPYFDYSANLPSLNCRLRLLKQLKNLPTLGIDKVFICSRDDLGYKLEAKDFDSILTNDLKSRRLESLPPFTRYLEIDKKATSSNIKKLLDCDFIATDNKEFTFLTHSQVKILQDYVAREHPDLKMKLDSPDFY